MIFIYEENGNEITGTYKEFYRKFVDSRYFNPIKSGFVSEPKKLIQSWLIDDLKLKFQDDKEHLYISDFIVCSL